MKIIGSVGGDRTAHWQGSLSVGVKSAGKKEPRRLDCAELSPDE